MTQERADEIVRKVIDARLKSIPKTINSEDSFYIGRTIGQIQRQLEIELSLEVGGAESEEITCETCKELNEEPNPVFVDNLYILTVGYYTWRKEIKYCPTCGRKILHKTVLRLAEERENKE